MNSLVGVWVPLGTLFLFMYRAFVPSEVNISVLLEDHAMDLGICAISTAWMSINLFKVLPKAPVGPVSPEPSPDPSPEPAPPPDPATPEVGPDPVLPEPEPTEPDQPAEPEPAPVQKQVRKFKV